MFCAIKNIKLARVELVGLMVALCVHLKKCQDCFLKQLCVIFFFNSALGAIKETLVLWEPVSLLLKEILSGRTIIVMCRQCWNTTIPNTAEVWTDLLTHRVTVTRLKSHSIQSRLPSCFSVYWTHPEVLYGRQGGRERRPQWLNEHIVQPVKAP